MPLLLVLLTESGASEAVEVRERSFRLVLEVAERRCDEGGGGSARSAVGVGLRLGARDCDGGGGGGGGREGGAGDDALLRNGVEGEGPVLLRLLFISIGIGLRARGLGLIGLGLQVLGLLMVGVGLRLLRRDRGREMAKSLSNGFWSVNGSGVLGLVYGLRNCCRSCLPALMVSIV